MKVIAITQARYGSTRLPGKVLKEAVGKTLLSIHIERIRKAKNINQLIVATTMEPEADAIVDIATAYNCGVYRGSLTDVLDRYYQAAKTEFPDYVVRITSDCPLVDPVIIDSIITGCVTAGYDYASNVLIRTFPDGMDVEVFTFKALEQAWTEAVTLFDREHVTPYIWRNSTTKGETLFKSYDYTGTQDYSNIRLTVDEPADFQLMRHLVEHLGYEQPWQVYADYVTNHKKLLQTNVHIK